MNSQDSRKNKATFFGHIQDIRK